jgi:DNA-binding NarL/FixJ family response regulator
MPVRIALLDDHLLFREGLRALILAQPDLTVVAEGSEARELYALLDEAAPDVAVIDLALPGSSGISATQAVARRWPACRVLVLTMHASADHVTRAFAAGATGYAIKEQGAQEVLDAIRRVAGGERYVAPSIPESFLAGTGAGTDLATLTPREREIFDLILASRSNRDIADYLGLSIKTVETHRAAINRKLGAHSTADLVRLAVRLRILSE